MQHYWSYFSSNCYSVIGIGEFAWAYFKHWSLQYILELFFTRNRQYVKTPDVSSMLSASLSWMSKESVSQTPLGKKIWIETPHIALLRTIPERKAGNPKIPNEGKIWGIRGRNGKLKEARFWPQTHLDWSFLYTSYLRFTQTLGGGTVIFALQMWKLRLREAARIGSDQPGLGPRLMSFSLL